MDKNEIKYRLHKCGYKTIKEFLTASGLQYTTLDNWSKNRAEFLEFLLSTLERSGGVE